MEDLTFGEQVKIMLSRRNMTIKQLAEMVEDRTGKPMSRQNMTQRLNRDNFQEQDMRMIAAILECPFHLSIFPAEGDQEEMEREKQLEAQDPVLRYAARALSKKKEEEKKKQSLPEPEPEPEAYQQELVFEDNIVKAEQEPEPEAETSEVPDVPEPGEDSSDERDLTIGELYDIHEELDGIEEEVQAGKPIEEVKEELEKPLIQTGIPEERQPEKKERFRSGTVFLRRMGFGGKDKKSEPAQEQPPQEPPVTEKKEKEEKRETAYQRQKEQDKRDFEPVIRRDDSDEDLTKGELNPYTGHEYQSNSVRMHPSRIGYVQVYDRKLHKWTDMTEWAFLGYQERKKALLGKDYEPPIYLD